MRRQNELGGHEVRQLLIQFIDPVKREVMSWDS